MKQICSILLFFLISAGSYAQNFADYFQNKTLRVDYIFTGNNKQQAIYLDELSQLPSWAGREHHLSELPLEGNGQIIVRDLATRQCIYKTSFSSLFQEWLSTDEANSQRLRKYILASLPQTAGRDRNRAVLSPQGSDDQLQAHCPSGRYLDS